VSNNFGDSNRADDLLPEESDTAQLALKRLSPKESYDRVFRIRRAVQVLTPHSYVFKMKTSHAFGLTNLS
jgi:hypothetical protein